MEGKNYKVQYRDDESAIHSIFTNAIDSYDARLMAMKEIQYLDAHPHAIEKISRYE
tara:strand:+ start:237 stop:404 length:168 start_codon:yes stop_codon:yes gene_type:complete